MLIQSFSRPTLALPQEPGERLERLAPSDPKGRSERRRAPIAAVGGARGLVAYFKARVYATFTGLAIVLVLSDTHPEPQRALLALGLDVVGIVVAGLVSEIAGHLVVHGGFSSRADLVVPLRVATAALSTLVVPAALLGSAWVGWMPLDAALWAASWVYIFTLVAIGLLAFRGAASRRWQTLLALEVLAVLALLVLLVKTLAKTV